tara:strand:+ start:1947 stop:2258 length:312 start_codon:yes stop_codon:yes gene_type:complete
MENRQYISGEYTGNKAECNKIRVSIGEYIKPLLGQEIRGYRFRTMNRQEDLIDEGFDDEDIDFLLQKTNSIFPFLYGVVSFNDSLQDPNKLKLEEKFGLVRIK